MKLGRETLLDLMAFADGELEGEAKARAERLVRENPEARQVVDLMRTPQVNAWLSDVFARQNETADTIADAVMTKLEPKPTAQASEGAKAARATGRARPKLGVSSFSRVQAAGLVLGGGLALAAAVAMIVRSAAHADRMATTRGALNHEPSEPAAASTSPIGQESRAVARGVEVDEIDSAEHVSIFAIPALANAATPSSVVVWIEDDSEGK